MVGSIVSSPVTAAQPIMSPAFTYPVTTSRLPFTKVSIGEEDFHRTRRRQPLGVSPVSFLNAAAKAVWEE
jgi:hypothetical protein